MAYEYQQWQDSPNWVATTSTYLSIASKSSQVLYAYEVNGVTYEGDRTHFFVTAVYQSNPHLDWINRHLSAEQVTVYYNPKNPQQAVLVREVEGDFWRSNGMMLIVVCGSVLFPVLFFVFIWRRLWQAFRD